MTQSDKNLDGPVGPDLLAWLLDRHAAALELYARQRCDCAEDVVQEALIELARQPQEPRDAVAWLYRVVRNKAIDASRSQRRRREREAAVSSENEWFVSSADDQIDARTAAAALSELPVEQREVVVARLWGGLTFEQIAALVGASDSAAQRRYQTALTELRRRLGVSCPTKINNH